MTPREWNAALGANIRRAREAAGMTITALAAKAKMTASGLSRCECGRQEIKPAQWAALADALGVAPSSLLPDLMPRRFAA
jgi:transcriptional regulator with XRE-family HTH domain